MTYISVADEAKFHEFVEQAGDEEKGLELLMRWKCLTDLYYLGSEILGMGKAKRMGDALLDPKFHGWLAETLSRDEHALIQLARGHLKTAWLCVYAVQLLLRNPNERVHIYSITQDFVETTHLVTIKQHLETPLLNKIFPDIVTPRDSPWEVDVKNRLLMRREKVQGEIVMGDQIQVYGVGNTITGKRATVQLFDDLIDKDTVRTIAQMEKTRQWFSGAMPILEPGGIRKMIGTPYHYNDLYHVIEEDEIFDKVYKRPMKVGGSLYASGGLRRSSSMLRGGCCRMILRVNTFLILCLSRIWRFLHRNRRTRCFLTKRLLDILRVTLRLLNRSIVMRQQLLWRRLRERERFT